MKRIITAIGNENLNQKLNAEKEFEIVTKDISYREGILEYLEKESNIDFLILSELLPGEIDLKGLIEKIKDAHNMIQIILFLENKNQELENYLYAKGVYFIFYHNQISISQIIEIMKDEDTNITKQLKNEIETLKQLLKEKESKRTRKMNFFQGKNRKSKSKNELIERTEEIEGDKMVKISEEIEIPYRPKQTLLQAYQNEQSIRKAVQSNEIIRENNLEGNHMNILVNKSSTENIEKEVICVSGTNGIGKSIFSINLAKSFMPIKNKILIIDFDVLNNSLHTILGIKKYPEKIRNKLKNNDLLKEIQVEELIMKVNSKIDLIAGINLLFDSKYKISSAKIKNILSKLKEKYETIIIDTSSECFLDYTKEIMKNSNVNIFITGANLVEIKKAKRLLNIYINEWEIPQSYFNILFNQYHKNSIDVSILKNVFSGFSILGKLSDNLKYNLLIDKNDVHFLEKGLQREYSQINKRILKS